MKVLSIADCAATERQCSLFHIYSIRLVLFAAMSIFTWSADVQLS